jgi:hypothetical protein
MASKATQPLHLLRRGRAACHHADRRCALSAFNASCPLRWQTASGSSCRRRACLTANSAPVPCGPLSSPSIIREASPARRGYADLGCQGARRLLQWRTFVAPSAISVMSLGPYVGAQYLCACLPSAIKGEACDVTRGDTQTLTSSYKLSSNTSHSGVGCYAPVARTTLNPCVFLCSSNFPTNKQNA